MIFIIFIYYLQGKIIHILIACVFEIGLFLYY